MVHGLNPIAGSIYSFDGVFSGLGLLHSGCDLSHNLILLNLSLWRFTAQISSVHRVVIRDEIQELCVIAWCAVVSHWVRNTMHSPTGYLTLKCPKVNGSEG